MSLFSNIFKPLLNVDAYPNSLWTEQHDKYELWWRYYSGEVLGDVDDPSSSTPIKKFPLGINLCRQMVKTNVYALLGDWEEKVFTWKSATGKPNQSVIEYLENTSLLSSMNSNYIRQCLTHTIMGGMIWKIHTYEDGRLRWVPIKPITFFPVFSSLDGELLEMILSFTMTGREANSRWPGYVSNDLDVVIYHEHWTRQQKVVTIGDKVVERRATIDGIIPYVYIPRISATGEEYGESLLDGIMNLQDEANFRLADMGDAINKETHRKPLLSNLPGGTNGIKETDLYVDLGMGVGRSNPTVHDYTKNSIPDGAMDSLKFVIDFSRHEANVPPVALGEDQGSQRSSLTLVTRMWPLVKSAQSNRAFIADGFTQLADKTLRMARKAGSIDGRLGSMSAYTVEFPPILPQDRAETINEISTLWGGGNSPLISVERAVSLLDVSEEDATEEISRIEKIHQESVKLQQEAASLKANTAKAGTNTSTPKTSQAKNGKNE
jgi:hypothetical protein